MLSPDEVFADGDSKIFTAFYHFQGVTVDLAAGVDYLSSVRVYPYYCTPLWVKLHLPACFPFL